MSVRFPGRTGAALLTLALGASGCFRGKPKLPAPDVGIEALLQAPMASIPSLAQFHGQVVVLEFWATWCHPCVSLIPHMNKKVAAFAGKPVRFISVTDESRETVSAFLKTHEMKAWIGLDPEHKAFDAFHVSSVPTAFVIDPYGRVWIKISPSFLYDSDIQAALDAPPPSTPPARP